MAWNEIANLTGPPGTTDHGALTGLGDDDHAQYLNNTRGDARYQPLDSDLTTLAGLAPSNGDMIRRSSGLWVAQSMSTVKTALALSKSDVGLGSVDNTSDAGKPVSTAQQTALDLKLTSTVARHVGVTTGATEVTTTSTTYVTLGTSDLSTTFTYPPSGIVTVSFRGNLYASVINILAIMSFEIRDTNSSGTVRTAASDSNATFGLSKTANESLASSECTVVVTGLPTSGTAYIRGMYRSNSGSSTAKFLYRGLTVLPSP